MYVQLTFCVQKVGILKITINKKISYSQCTEILNILFLFEKPKPVESLLRKDHYYDIFRYNFDC